MTIPGSSNPLLLAGSAAAPAGYNIERSVRFNSADSAYLSRTPASAGNRKTWTWAGWVKRSKLGAYQNLFGWVSTVNSSYQHYIDFSNTDKIRFTRYNLGDIGSRVTTAVYRDLSAWLHICAVWDTTQSAANDRMQLYVNGIKITAFDTTVNPSQNYDGEINNAIQHGIGSTAPYLANSGDFYLADIHFIDGQALDPTSFGEFDSNGVWQPKAYTGSYGTNGFHLPFSDNSTAAALGTDTSGNGNTWTVNNISVAAGAGNDSLVDSPTNYGTDTGVGGEVRGNYATLNPLTASSVFTLTNGNLDVSDSGSAAPVLLSSIAVNSGKWYWEVTLGNATAYVGAAKPTSRGSVSYLGANSGQFIYNPNGIDASFINGVQYNYSTASPATTGDIIGVALDFDANQIVFYKNGVSMGVFGSNVLGSDSWSPAFKSNVSSSATFNFGQRPFAYTAPSGFKALCTANLPTPTIADGSTAMDVVTYTGNGGTQTISGLGFNPDFIWIKARSSAQTHSLTDSVRGTNAQLFTNLTNVEGTQSDQVTAFNSDGFSLGANVAGTGGVNTSSVTYVAWTWDAGSSTVTNTDGSITSSVRANPSAGFSIVTWTGGTNPGSIGHGLGVSPELIITKSRDDGTSGWYVYHKSLGAGAFLRLDTTNTSASSTTIWNNTTPSSTVISFNSTGSNPSTANIAYCFAPVEGFSAFGSYTGNGSADGPFVYLGFRPRWVMVKASSTTGFWQIEDAARGATNEITNKPLFPNSSLAEGGSGYAVDFLSNGFKFRNSGSNYNTSGATYIYAAFAEHPFNFSRAR